VDLQLESGEYFLKTTEKEKREEEKRKQKVRSFCGLLTSARFTHFVYRFQQAEATEKRRQERAEVFIAPVEDAAPTVEEKRKKRRLAETVEGVDEGEKTKKKKRKKEKVQDDQN
jgi:ribosomal RNA assembly protein